MIAFNDLHILIVDPKAGNARLLRALLTMLGVKHITNVENSNRAFELLASSDFDIVLCDEAIGPLDAVNFAQTLRKDRSMRNQRTPIIFLSNQPRKRLVELARDSGVNDILVWPLSINGVKRKIRMALTRAKPFIDTEAFAGPDRRYRSKQAPSDAGIGGKDRRTGKAV